MVHQRPVARSGTVAENETCPDCDGSEITFSMVNHRFIYGPTESGAELSATVKVYKCEICDFEYLDGSGMMAEHAAICRHLGVLSPDEIRKIRGKYGMTRAKFAQITALDEALVNKLEKGSIFQTLANDRYLRLLSYSENMQRLENL